MDNSLEIKGTEENEYFNLKSQWVQEAKSVRLCGGGGEDFYEIDLTTTEKHSLPHITIDNLDINKAKDYLKIFIKEYNKTKLSRKDNDLHIFNEADHIFIKNIFADNKADYNHLSIEFIGQEKTKSFEVDVIVNKWIALDDSNQYLNSRHLPLSDFERYLIPISSLEK